MSKIPMIQSLKNCMSNLETGFWDRWLGIRTLGVRPGVSPTGGVNGDQLYYQSKCYWTVRACLGPVKITTEDVFYDVGCGAGRVLCIVAQRRLCRCVGVELSDTLCSLARENARRLRRRRTPIEIVEGDAALVDYSDGTIFFFYNPFGPQTLGAVLHRIGESVQRKPRRVQCIYLNPAACSVFDSQEWLKGVAQRSVGTGGLLVNYYSSTDERKGLDQNGFSL